MHLLVNIHYASLNVISPQAVEKMESISFSNFKFGLKIESVIEKNGDLQALLGVPKYFPE